MEHNGKRSVVNIVGAQVINHYLCAIRQQVDIQCWQNKITIQKMDLMRNRMKGLVTLVGKSKERVLKELCKERIDGSFQPFKLEAEVPNMEIKMWVTHNNTRVYDSSSVWQISVSIYFICCYEE